MSDLSPPPSRWALALARLRRKIEHHGWANHWDLRLLALVMAILVWLFVKLRAS